MKYQKPIVIEAIQYKEDNLQEIMDFVGPSMEFMENSIHASRTSLKRRTNPLQTKTKK